MTDDCFSATLTQKVAKNLPIGCFFTKETMNIKSAISLLRSRLCVLLAFANY